MDRFLMVEVASRGEARRRLDQAIWNNTMGNMVQKVRRAVHRNLRTETLVIFPLTLPDQTYRWDPHQHKHKHSAPPRSPADTH